MSFSTLISIRTAAEDAGCKGLIRRIYVCEIDLNAFVTHPEEGKENAQKLSRLFTNVFKKSHPLSTGKTTLSFRIIKYAMLSVAGSLPPLHIPRRGWLALSDKHVLSGIGPFVESWHASGNCKEEWKSSSRLGVFDGENYIAQLIALPNGHVLARSNSRLAVIHSSQLETNGQLQEGQTVSPRLTSRVVKKKEKEEQIEEQILHVELLEQRADEGCFRLLVWTSFHVRLLELMMGSRLQCTVNNSIATWGAVVDRVSVELVDTDVFLCAAESVDDAATFLCEVSTSRKLKTVQRLAWKKKHITPIPLFDETTFSWQLDDEEMGTYYEEGFGSFWHQHRPTNTVVLVEEGRVELYSFKDKECTIRWSGLAPFKVHSIGAVTQHSRCCYTYWLGGKTGEVCRLRIPVKASLREVNQREHTWPVRSLAVQPNGDSLALYKERSLLVRAQSSGLASCYGDLGLNCTHIAVQSRVPLQPGCYENRAVDSLPTVLAVLSSATHHWLATTEGVSSRRLLRIGAAGVRQVHGVRFLTEGIFLAVVRREGTTSNNLISLSSSSCCVLREPEATWRSFPLNAVCCIQTNCVTRGSERLVVILRGRGQLCQLRLKEKKNEWTTDMVATLMVHKYRKKTAEERAKHRGKEKDEEYTTDRLPLERACDVVDIAADSDLRSRLCVLERNGRFRKLPVWWDEENKQYAMGRSGMAGGEITRALPLEWAYHLVDGSRYAVGVSKGAFVIVHTESAIVLAELANTFSQQLVEMVAPAWAVDRVRGDDWQTPATLAVQTCERDSKVVVHYELDMPSLLVAGFPSSLSEAARPRIETHPVRIVNIGAAQVVFRMVEAGEWEDDDDMNRRVDLAVHVDWGDGRVHHSIDRTNDFQWFSVMAIGSRDSLTHLPIVDVVAGSRGEFCVYHCELDKGEAARLHPLLAFNPSEMIRAIHRSNDIRKRELIDLMSTHSLYFHVYLKCRTLCEDGEDEKEEERERTLRMLICFDAKDKKVEKDVMGRYKLSEEQREELDKREYSHLRCVTVFDLIYESSRKDDGKWTLDDWRLDFRMWYQTTTTKNDWNPLVIRFIDDHHINIWSEKEGGPTRTFRIGEEETEKRVVEKNEQEKDSEKKDQYHSFGVNFTLTHSVVYLVEAYASLCADLGEGKGHLVAIAGEDRPRTNGLIDVGWQVGGVFTSLAVAQLPNVRDKACLTHVVHLRERVLSPQCSVLWVVSQQDLRRPISVHYLVLRWRHGVPKVVGQFSHAFDMDCVLDNDSSRARLCYLVPQSSPSATTLEGFSMFSCNGQAQTIRLCDCHQEIIRRVERNAPKQAERASLKRKTP